MLRYVPSAHTVLRCWILSNASVKIIFLSFIFLFFNWNCFIVFFCHMTMQFSLHYTCIISLLNLPVLPLPKSSESTTPGSLLHGSFSPASTLQVAVCICRCYFLHVALCPPLTVSTGSCSVSISLPPCRWVHQCHLSATCVLIYSICFSLMYFTLCNRLWFHPLHYNWLNFILFYGWVIFHCMYVPQLLHPFIYPSLLIGCIKLISLWMLKPSLHHGTWTF